MTVAILDTQEEKISILNSMRAQQLDKVIIYSLDECSDEQWLEMLKNAWCLTVRTDEGPAGIAWFDNIYGKTAQSHFCPLRENFEHTAAFGKAIIQWLEDKLDVKMLTGITPVPFRQSKKMMPVWGFEEVLKMPEACYLAKYKKHVDGILYVRKS